MKNLHVRKNEVQDPYITLEAMLQQVLRTGATDSEKNDTVKLYKRNIDVD